MACALTRTYLVDSAKVTSQDELHEAAAAVRRALPEIDQYVRRSDFHGYDPFDALMSPLFRLPVLRSNHYIRLAAQQVLKRLPVNPRRVIGIAPHLSAVTCARMLEGYVHVAAVDADGRRAYAEAIDACLRRIDELRSPGYSGDCWGYEFDWEPRYAIPIPAGTPNIVATGIVTNALFDAYRLAGSGPALESCASAAEFVVRDLDRSTRADGSFCWGYFPHDRQLVLNATLKGARLCAQVFSSTGDAELLTTARQTVRFVSDQQRPDGGWPYSVGDPRSWVDNFHTGYVLDCLDAYERCTGDEEFAATRERGWRYYRTHFLTDDFLPKYFDQRLYPIDATACAQTVTTLCTFKDVSAAARVALSTLAHMRRRDGGFVYQRHARFTNRVPYLRWSIAPMFAALGRLLYALEGSGP